MKINTRQKRNYTKPLMVAVFLLAAATATYLTVAYQRSLWPFGRQESFNTELPTTSQVGAGKQQKSQSAETSNATKQATGSDPAPPPQQPADGSKASVGFNIVSANVNSSNSILYIRTILQAVTSNGTCNLTMTGPGGKEYTATAAIQAGPSNSSCKGFTIPTSDLAPGNWDISIQYDSDTATGFATNEVTI